MVKFLDPRLHNEDGWLSYFQSGGNKELMRRHGNAWCNGDNKIWNRIGEDVPLPITTVVSIRYDACDVYCGRGTPLGNPFIIGRDGNRKTVIAKFTEHFMTRISMDPDFKEMVCELAGMRLGCHCKPQDCHLDPVAAWLNGVSI